MTGAPACLPPPGTASGTTHVLAGGGAFPYSIAVVWGGDEWVTFDDVTTTPEWAADMGYRYLGPLTLPAEVERLRAALQTCITALTDKRLGTWDYMEGDEIYGDFAKAVAESRAALEPSAMESPHE